MEARDSFCFPKNTKNPNYWVKPRRIYFHHQEKCILGINPEENIFKQAGEA